MRVPVEDDCVFTIMVLYFTLTWYIYLVYLFTVTWLYIILYCGIYVYYYNYGMVYTWYTIYT